MGCATSRAAVLSDAEFQVTLPSHMAIEWLSTPENWKRVIPGACGGNVYYCPHASADWEGDKHFCVRSKTTQFHFLDVTKVQGATWRGQETAELTYQLLIGEVSSPSAKFLVQYTFTDGEAPAAGSQFTTVRRRSTDFVQLKSLHLPYRYFIRSGMKKENKEMARLMNDANEQGHVVYG